MKLKFFSFKWFKCDQQWVACSSTACRGPAASPGP